MIPNAIVTVSFHPDFSGNFVLAFLLIVTPDYYRDYQLLTKYFNIMDNLKKTG